MAGLYGSVKQPTLRDGSVKGNTWADDVDKLDADEWRLPGSTLLPERDGNEIQANILAIMQGQHDYDGKGAERVQKLMKRNPYSASMFAQAAAQYDAMKRQSASRAETVKDYISPAEPFSGEFRGQGAFQIGEIVPARRNPRGLVEELARQGDFEGSKSYAKAFGVSDNSGNVPASIQEYEYYQSLKTPQEKRNFEMLKKAGWKLEKIGGALHLVPTTPGESPIPLSSLSREVNAAKDLASGKASGEVEGKDKGAAEVELKTADLEVQELDQNIEELINHPGLKSSTGVFSLVEKPAPGTAQANWVAKYNQLMGTLFLRVYQRLRGGGQITEIETKQAREAMAAMARAQTPEDWVKEARKLQKANRAGLEKLYRRAGRPQPESANQSGNKVIKYSDM